jgi:hypothetical protein
MGWFSSKPEEPASPPRRDRVRQVMQAYMEESDADPDGPGARAAAKKLSAARRGGTEAEYQAGIAAARRNGY